jgi:hypothetical protein
VYTENSYNQTLAYRIDGPDVTYLGDEDLHDTRYDSLEFADINAHVPSQAGPRTRSYTAVPLNRSSEVHSYIPLVIPKAFPRTSHGCIRLWWRLRSVYLYCLSCLRTLWNGGKIVMNEVVETAERLPL